MLLSRLPEEILNKYNLKELAVDGLVYIEIRKGMYALKQAGLLANQLRPWETGSTRKTTKSPNGG
jgi:hypothetical protein